MSTKKLNLKIKWIVSTAPTGKYRSFECREWPSAEYEDGSPMAFITCEDEYYYPNVKIGDHKELILHVCDYSQEPWKRRTLTKRFKTLQDAKKGLIEFFTNHPEFIKNEYK